MLASTLPLLTIIASTPSVSFGWGVFISPNGIPTISLNDGGDRIAVGSDAGEMFLLESSKSGPTRRVLSCKGWFPTFFGPSDLVFYRDSCVWSIPLDAGREPKMLFRLAGACTALVASRKEGKIVVGSDNNVITEWDVASRTSHTYGSHGRFIVGALTFDSEHDVVAAVDSTPIVFGGIDRIGHSLDEASNSIIHKGYVDRLAWNGPTKSLVSGGQDRFIALSRRRGSGAAMSFERRIALLAGRPVALGLSEDGSRLIAAIAARQKPNEPTSVNAVEVRSLPSGRRIARVPVGATVTAASVSRNGRVVVVATLSGMVLTYEVSK